MTREKLMGQMAEHTIRKLKAENDKLRVEVEEARRCHALAGAERTIYKMALADAWESMRISSCGFCHRASGIIALALQNKATPQPNQPSDVIQPKSVEIQSSIRVADIQIYCCESCKHADFMGGDVFDCLHPDHTYENLHQVDAIGYCDLYQPKKEECDFGYENEQKFDLSAKKEECLMCKGGGEIYYDKTNEQTQLCPECGTPLEYRQARYTDGSYAREEIPVCPNPKCGGKDE